MTLALLKMNDVENDHCIIYMIRNKHCFYSRVVGPYSLDVVTSSSFSIDIDSINNADDPFVTNIKKFFQFSLFNPLILILGMSILSLKKCICFWFAL